MFKAILIAILSIFLAFNITLPATSDLGNLPNGKEIDLSEYELTWSDEFDGDSLDRTKWGFTWWETMRKGGYWHEDMVRVEGGNLIISAEYKDEPLEANSSSATAILRCAVSSLRQRACGAHSG